MATMIVAGSSMPALAAAGMLLTSPPAWSQVIAFRVTSSCSLFGTTCSWVPRPNASLASSQIEALMSAGGRSCAGSRKFGPAFADAVRQYRNRPVTTWLVDETYVKILGKWHYLYRGVDLDGQVLDCWLSATRDLPAAEAFFRRTIASTGCVPEHIVTDKATFYPSAIRTWAPDAKHTATGFYNRVISTNRCERNHGYLKSRLRHMRGLKKFDCAKRLFSALDALQVIERGFVAVPCARRRLAGGRSYVRACHVAGIVNRLGQSM